MPIIRNGSNAAVNGPAASFTGSVRIETPNVRHWHGATATTSCTHLAIAEARDGKSVEWMEHVIDEQYLAGQTQFNNES